MNENFVGIVMAPNDEITTPCPANPNPPAFEKMSCTSTPLHASSIAFKYSSPSLPKSTPTVRI